MFRLKPFLPIPFICIAGALAGAGAVFLANQHHLETRRQALEDKVRALPAIVLAQRQEDRLKVEKLLANTEFAADTGLLLKEKREPRLEALRAKVITLAASEGLPEPGNEIFLAGPDLLTIAATPATFALRAEYPFAKDVISGDGPALVQKTLKLGTRMARVTAAIVTSNAETGERTWVVYHNYLGDEFVGRLRQVVGTDVVLLHQDAFLGSTLPAGLTAEVRGTYKNLLKMAVTDSATLGMAHTGSPFDVLGGMEGWGYIVKGASTSDGLSYYVAGAFGSPNELIERLLALILMVTAVSCAFVLIIGLNVYKTVRKSVDYATTVLNDALDGQYDAAQPDPRTPAPLSALEGVVAKTAQRLKGVETKQRITGEIQSASSAGLAKDQDISSILGSSPPPRLSSAKLQMAAAVPRPAEPAAEARVADPLGPVLENLGAPLAPSGGPKSDPLGLFSNAPGPPTPAPVAPPPTPMPAPPPAMETRAPTYETPDVPPLSGLHRIVPPARRPDEPASLSGTTEDSTRMVAIPPEFLSQSAPPRPAPQGFVAPARATVPQSPAVNAHSPYDEDDEEPPQASNEDATVVGRIPEEFQRMLGIQSPSAMAPQQAYEHEDEAPAGGGGATVVARLPEQLMRELSGAPGTQAAPAQKDPFEAHARQVFDEYIAARVRCGESVQGVTFDKFFERLQGNRNMLIQKHGCKDVRFKVQVKDGKTSLKATPV